MDSASANAPLFIAAFYDACTSYAPDDPDFFVPNVSMMNAVLTRHRVGYVIEPPRLVLRDKAGAPIEVVQPAPTLAELANDLVHQSLSRSEQLLADGHEREAVQESLWLLETVSTAFKGVETATGTIEGKYFNQIVNELRSAHKGTTLQQILTWTTTLHGYLSSPTGGGVRHGTDLATGIEVSPSEARLYCNLIRSYLSFLLMEHERLVRSKA